MAGTIDVTVEIISAQTDVTVGERDGARDVTVDVVQLVQEGEPYSGSYEVTPTLEEQTLLTGKKYLEQDVIVHAIPSKEELNASGGVTLTIGG